MRAVNNRANPTKSDEKKAGNPLEEQACLQLLFSPTPHFVSPARKEGEPRGCHSGNRKYSKELRLTALIRVLASSQPRECHLTPSGWDFLACLQQKPRKGPHGRPTRTANYTRAGLGDCH